MSTTAITAGELNKRVTIQRPILTDDEGGGQSISWTDWQKNVHAKIEPGGGREFVAARAVTPELSHTITIRYRACITPKHRLRWVSTAGDRTFAIHAVVDAMEQHESLLLFCTEIPATDA